MLLFTILTILSLSTVLQASRLESESTFAQLQHLHNEKAEEIRGTVQQGQSTVGMTVLYAYYGLSCANGDVQKSNQDRTTRFAKHLCDGKNSCSGYVHTSILTDPYYGCRKDFLVVAQCPGGEIISSHLTPEAQGKTFRLTCQCQCA